MGLRETIYFLIGMFIGVILHEYMHGRIADMLGDKTARNAGRLTLNPIPHIDPFGTLLVPLALIVFRSPFIFGYAKPVPVNPFFLRRRRRDMMLIALAGPMTNFAIAFAVAFIGFLCRVFGLNPFSEVFRIIFSIAQINIILGFFNLIPVPPLDGSHVVEYFLPSRAQRAYESIAPYGFVIIIGFLLLAGDYFFRWMEPVFSLIFRITYGIWL